MGKESSGVGRGVHASKRSTAFTILLSWKTSSWSNLALDESFPMVLILSDLVRRFEIYQKRVAASCPRKTPNTRLKGCVFDDNTAGNHWLRKGLSISEPNKGCFLPGTGVEPKCIEYEVICAGDTRSSCTPLLKIGCVGVLGSSAFWVLPAKYFIMCETRLFTSEPAFAADLRSHDAIMSESRRLSAFAIIASCTPSSENSRVHTRTLSDGPDDIVYPPDDTNTNAPTPQAFQTKSTRRVFGLWILLLVPSNVNREPRICSPMNNADMYISLKKKVKTKVHALILIPGSPLPTMESPGKTAPQQLHQLIISPRTSGALRREAGFDCQHRKNALQGTVNSPWKSAKLLRAENTWRPRFESALNEGWPLNIDLRNSGPGLGYWQQY
ncbi:hypothetical protein B0H14DRAFT_2582442 [Mycena olivaceomarginata]|nr:hypothetical protein B0H14DRAFT_2582442 [Mycena olivaceomarginata]